MKKNNKQNGFTIIETMISVSLFILIVMAGMGALLNANLLHQKSQDMRSITDNLSFIMEDMSRNLRTGYDYHCFISGDTISFGPIGSQSCESGNGGGISFKSTSPGGQWVYYIDINPNTSKLSIFKSVNGDIVQLTPDEVEIDPVSSFSVFGAEPSPDDRQPFVTIKIVGTIKFKNIVTPFSLQTSVSQRLIDS